MKCIAILAATNGFLNEFVEVIFFLMLFTHIIIFTPVDVLVATVSLVSEETGRSCQKSLVSFGMWNRLCQ